MSVRQIICLGLASAATAVARSPFPSNSSCRVLPGDAAWPNAPQWASLNKTVSGRLIASVPESSVCHQSPFNDYNAAACAVLQSTWNETELSHLGSPAEILSQSFQNYSCVPYTSETQPCELGNYASYVVNIAGADDVRGAIAFAREHNVRLVIKNTGHDYLGKSTGKGGISLWTHNLKSTEYIPSYNASYYNGPAAKFGAGIEGYEAMAFANSTGHTVVGGACPTVGIAGGFSLGGGHSILSSSYGMGSDNVLEWEVVTMNGSHLVATPNQHSDLYWAMSGGGGGTFAVVLSMTARLNPGGIVGGTILSFNDSVVGNDAYWEAVGAFHALLPAFLDAGNSFTYSIGNSAITAYGTMPGADLDQVESLLKPFQDDLTKRGIAAQITPNVEPSYYSHFYDYLGPAPLGSADFEPFTNSRIFPRAMVEDPARNAIVTEVLRNVSLFPAFSPFYCDSFNVSHQAHPDNAVLPAWRDGIFLCSPAGRWDWDASQKEMAARDEYAANVLQPMLDAATPGGGVYLNEANHLYQDWKEGFYGANYDKLLAVKRAYDPESLLYARTAVGSDEWREDADGRLCRA